MGMKRPVGLKEKFLGIDEEEKNVGGRNAIQGTTNSFSEMRRKGIWPKNRWRGGLSCSTVREQDGTGDGEGNN